MPPVSKQRRHNNRRRVLDALRRQGPASRASLARSLGLSKVTLSAIANEVLADGWVTECDSEPGGIGRRPILLSLAPTLGVVAAVDIHARSLTLQLADLRGELLTEHTHVTPTDAEGLRKLVVDELASMCAECGCEPTAMRAITLAVPAAVDTAGQLNAVGRPACLAHIDWYQHLEAAFTHASVHLINNSNAATLAEHVQGAATDWAHFAYIGIGQSGFGAGLVLDGELYRGSHHGAGEIGALMLGHDEQTLDALVDLPRDTHFYRQLARLVALMDHLLDLDGVIFHALDVDQTTWQQQLSPLLAEHALRPIMLRAASLGAQAPLLGAAHLAGEQAWTDLLTRVANDA